MSVDPNIELIEKARNGERIRSPYSMHDTVRDIPCSHSRMFQVVIACDTKHDVVECSNCGRQAVLECSQTRIGTRPIRTHE